MAVLITDDPNRRVIVGGITFDAPPAEPINESRRLAREAIEKYRREKRRKEIFERVKARIFGK